MTDFQLETTLRENETLRRENVELQARLSKRGGEKSSRGFLGCLGSIAFWLIVCGMAALLAFAILPDLLVSYGYVSEETMRGVMKMGSVGATPQPGAPTPRPTIPAPFGSTAPRSSLPDCATVTDTTTACQNTGGPAPVEQAAPIPTMALAPAAVECWTGSFYTCEELAELGERRAVDAVQSTDTFIDPATLPTPEPAFVQYATDACAAAAVKSILCP